MEVARNEFGVLLLMLLLPPPTSGWANFFFLIEGFPTRDTQKNDEMNEDETVMLKQMYTAHTRKVKVSKIRWMTSYQRDLFNTNHN